MDTCMHAHSKGVKYTLSPVSPLAFTWMEVMFVGGGGNILGTRNLANALLTLLTWEKMHTVFSSRGK
jgi:NAD(P)H-dependent FMN reductase